MARVHRYIYIGRGLVNVPPTRRRWLELIFSVLLLTTMTTILVQLVLFCNFSVHSGELKMFFLRKVSSGMTTKLNLYRPAVACSWKLTTTGRWLADDCLMMVWKKMKTAYLMTSLDLPDNLENEDLNIDILKWWLWRNWLNKILGMLETRKAVLKDNVKTN